MKIINCMLALVFSSLVFSCGQSAEHTGSKTLTPGEIDQIKREINERMAGVIEGINTNNQELIFADFIKSDSALFILNGMEMRGYDQILKVFSEGAQGRNYAAIEIHSDEVIVLDSDVAMHHAEFTNTTGVSADSTQSVYGYWSALFKRMDGRWKVVHVHESFNPVSQ